ncbi:hypothetical protein Pan44_36200 [Caulifigura coniformis]|uniref:Uncharacterized protein n=1 Tax=Caulifigura coniformis TaxID=2527983 RepID=A0A517SHH9_9PLAN|nr:hypothetical protein [Caulifigura coniformis]QDT55575.1 hypothetical protein Pan44_36200 [Caulifigura coniformis]
MGYETTQRTAASALFTCFEVTTGRVSRCIAYAMLRDSICQLREQVTSEPDPAERQRLQTHLRVGELILSRHRDERPFGTVPPFWDFKSASEFLDGFLAAVDDGLGMHLQEGKPLCDPEFGLTYRDTDADFEKYAWWETQLCDRVLSEEATIVRSFRSLPDTWPVCDHRTWVYATAHGAAARLLNEVLYHGIVPIMENLEEIRKLRGRVLQERLLVSINCKPQRAQESEASADVKEPKQLQYEFWASHRAWSAAEAKRAYEKTYDTAIPSVRAFTKACERWAKQEGLPLLGRRRKTT